MDTLDNCFDHGSKGSFLEADLHYPDKLHNLYNFKICIICTKNCLDIDYKSIKRMSFFSAKEKIWKIKIIKKVNSILETKNFI